MRLRWSIRAPVKRYHVLDGCGIFFIAMKGDDRLAAKKNQMWRNQCISDTYEPGSTFKIITAAAALEQGVVKLTDNFYCPGYKLVEDRRIRCAKTTGHGAETFETGIMNSCKTVFFLNT